MCISGRPQGVKYEGQKGKKKRGKQRRRRRRSSGRRETKWGTWWRRWVLRSQRRRGEWQRHLRCPWCGHGGSWSYRKRGVVRVSCTPTACRCGGSGHGRERSRWIGSQHVLGFILIYSSNFDVFCWYWLLFVLSLSFIWTRFRKFCSFRFIEMVWNVFDLNLLCRVSIEEILRFPELGFDCYCEWWCLFVFT